MSVKGCYLGLALTLVFLVTTANSARAALPSSVQPDDLKTITRFATWQGVEPDKWATAWLIKRHISPDAYFLLVPPRAEMPDRAFSFGVPTALIKRANRESMFRRLKSAMSLDGEALNYIDAIIHDVEVNIWDAPAHPHSLWFETLYRQLQARYDRDQVPVDCYLALFDALASQAGRENLTAKDYQKALDIEGQCPGLTSEKPGFVEAMNHRQILREISLGKRVVFVDTREDEEFNEVHLPGAELVRLRDVTAERVQTFADADLVVPYCVKDFRGFEVAKAMKLLGLSRVATLSPNGLRGWISAELPVVKAGGMTQDDAAEALMRCATDPGKCIKGEGI